MKALLDLFRNNTQQEEFDAIRIALASPEKIRWFQKELLDRGYITTVRVTMGKDILAACGQLRTESEKSQY